MRLYHPELDQTADVPDDEGLFNVLKESGWSKTIPAEHTDPALAPEQPDVVYQPVSPDDVPGPPALAAAKAEWVDYAVSQGADRAEAEALTKTELIDQYKT